LRRVPFPSPAPRERRHENTVLERTSAEFDWAKEIWDHRVERAALSMAQRHNLSINQKVHTRFRPLSEV
jgi:hypothetical protein